MSSEFKMILCGVIKKDIVPLHAIRVSNSTDPNRDILLPFIMVETVV